MWDGKRFYPAIITKVNKDWTYDITFLDDYEQIKSVPSTKVKTMSKKSKSVRFRWLSHVDELVGKTFFDPGSSRSDKGGYFEKGEFVIVGRVVGTNKYECRRVFTSEEGVEDEIVQFDVIYLMQRVREYAKE